MGWFLFHKWNCCGCRDCGEIQFQIDIFLPEVSPTQHNNCIIFRRGTLALRGSWCLTPTYIWGSFLKDNLSTIFLRIFDNHLFIVITSSALGTGPVRFSTRQTTRSSFPSTSNVLPVVIFLSLHFLFPDMPLNLALSSFFPRLRTAPLTELGRGMEQGSTSTFPSAPPMRG